MRKSTSRSRGATRTPAKKAAPKKTAPKKAAPKKAAPKKTAAGSVATKGRRAQVEAKPATGGASERPDDQALTARLHGQFPPREGWTLEVRTASGPDRVGLHLLDGSHRYGIWVMRRSGGSDPERWNLMYEAIAALFGQLLADDLVTGRNLPQPEEGEHVRFPGDVVMKVVVENQWSGNKVAPTYPL